MDLARTRFLGALVGPGAVRAEAREETVAGPGPALAGAHGAHGLPLPARPRGRVPGKGPGREGEQRETLREGPMSGRVWEMRTDTG